MYCCCAGIQMRSNQPRAAADRAATASGGPMARSRRERRSIIHLRSMLYVPSDGRGRTVSASPPSAARRCLILAIVLKRVRTSMNSRVQLADRLRQSLDIVNRRGVPAQIANLLSPPTSEELGRRRAHLLALLLVAMIGAAGHVTGVTDRNAQYTVYLTAIAIAAVIGGLAPACVATLAAVLLADADAASSAGSAGRLMFACEGLAVAWVVGAMSDKLRE